AVVVHSLNRQADGMLAVSADGVAPPAQVTLQYDSPAASVLTVVPVAVDGSVKVVATAATTVVVDVVGYFTDVETSSAYQAHPLAPGAVMNTSTGAGHCNGTTSCPPLAAGVPVTVKVTG